MKRIVAGILAAGTALSLGGGAGAQTSVTTTTTTESYATVPVEIAPERRQVIRETIVREWTPSDAATPPDFAVDIGQEVPGSIELRAFPETVVTEVPEYGQYRYTVVADQVLVVDPNTNRVIDLYLE